MKSYATAVPSIPDADPLTTARTRDAQLSDASPAAATRDEILRRAYEIWENEGHPGNRELENWLQAETDVCGREKWGRA